MKSDIPVHSFKSNSPSEIRVVQLNALTEYDSTKLHRHNYFELFVFEKGGGQHQIDFENFEIKSNSIHIVAPGQVHQARRNLDSNGFVLLFDLGTFTGNKAVVNFLFDHVVYGIDERNPCYEFNEQAGKRMVDRAKEIWQDYQTKDDLWEVTVQNGLSNLCVSCIRLGDYRALPSESGEQLYQDFRRLLKDDFTRIHKVKDYALSLGVTENQLNDIVSKKTGQSCSALIYNQLILEAKRQLHTGISSKEVTYALNFHDPAHFSKFFKRHTGMSPSQFSKMK